MADLHNILNEVEDGVEDYSDDNNHNDNINQHDEPQEEENQPWDDDGDSEQVDLEELRQNQFQEDEADDDADAEAMALGANNMSSQSAELDQRHYYRRLKYCWQQELASPELLSLHDEDKEMITTVQNQLERRDATLVQLTSSEGVGDMEALLASIIKVDMDRAKFMLTDLLRTRLKKIQEHAFYMIQEGYQDRMTDQEVEFLHSYEKLVKHHLQSTVTDHIVKDAFNGLTDKGMVDPPNQEQYVFCKVEETSEIDAGGGVPRVHEAGTSLITRFDVVRHLFAEGKVSLHL